MKKLILLLLVVPVLAFAQPKQKPGRQKQHLVSMQLWPGLIIPLSQ